MGIGLMTIFNIVTLYPMGGEAPEGIEEVRKKINSRRNWRMSKDEYLITDAPLKALTVFAMPMILGSFFQQVYNMADSIIVGQFVGSLHLRQLVPVLHLRMSSFV